MFHVVLSVDVMVKLVLQNENETMIVLKNFETTCQYNICASYVPVNVKDIKFMII